MHAAGAHEGNCDALQGSEQPQVMKSTLNCIWDAFKAIKLQNACWSAAHLLSKCLQRHGAGAGVC
jgi:hypothetical protein